LKGKYRLTPLLSAMKRAWQQMCVAQPFGYLKAGVALQRRGIYGLFTAAELCPSC
jgi:hypothetical protein